VFDRQRCAVTDLCVRQDSFIGVQDLLNESLSHTLLNESCVTQVVERVLSHTLLNESCHTRC